MTMYLEAPVTGEAPVLTEDDFLALLGHDTASVGDAPTLQPPTDPDAEASEQAGLITGKLITVMFADQSNKNTWVNVAGVGWRKLSQTSDAGSLALTLIAGHAKMAGRAPVLGDDATGVVQNIYVW